MVSQVPIQKDTYRDMRVESKLDVIFDYIVEIYERDEQLTRSFVEQKAQCAKEFKVDRKYQFTLSGVMGLVGGMIAVIFGWLWK